MRKLMRILFRVLLGIIVLILILLGAVYLMEDRIVAKVVEHMEESYMVDVEYDDVDISILSSFPDVGVNIQNMNVKNKKDTVSFMEFSELDMDFDFMSVIREEGALKIKEFNVRNPLVIYEIYADSSSSFDAFLSSGEDVDTTATALEIDLNSYSISEGVIIYLDQTSGTNINLTGFHHSGSGNMAAEEFILDSYTRLDSFSAVVEGLTYANNLSFESDATLRINTKTSLYSLQDANLSLNSLKMVLDGHIQLKDEAIETDIQINNASSSIAPLLSLIPSAYSGDYSDIDAEGELQLAGNISGIYSYEGDNFPAVGLNLNIDNGNLQYPDLPEKIQNLNANISIEKTQGALNNTIVKLQPLSMNIGSSSSMNITASIRDLMTSPVFSGDAKGNLDLNTLANAYPIPDMKSMSGQLDFDALFDVNMRDIENENYEEVSLSGAAELSNSTIEYASYPVTKINSASAQLSAEKAGLDNIDLSVGRSDFKGSLELMNPLSLLTQNGSIDVRINGNSDFVDLNSLLPAEDESNSTASEPSLSPSDAEFIDNLSIDAEYTANEIQYASFNIKNLDAAVEMSNSELFISNAEFVYQANPIVIRGNFRNIGNYLYMKEALEGKLTVNSSSFDLYEFMNSGTATASEDEPQTAEDFVLPKNMNLTINSNVGKLSYDDIQLRDLNAEIDVLENQEIFISESSARTMGGKMILKGSFTARDGEKPFYDFDYTIERLNIPQATRDVELVGKLAPIAEYMQGFMNTNIKLSGNLTKELYPEISSLSLDGIVETVDASVRNFEALKKVGNLLNIKTFDNIKLQNTRNFLEVENGGVLVKPFEVSFQELNGTVSGTHRIDGSSMNYTFETVIPREWLKTNQISGKLEQGLSFLEKQANSRGLNLNAGDQFYVDFVITGTLKDPKVDMRLKDVTGKSVADAAKERLEKERKRVQDSIENALRLEKQKLEKEAKERLDSIKNAARQDAKDKAREILTGEKGEKSGATKEEIDKARKEAKEKIEESKKKLKKLNPFGGDD